MNGFLLPVLIAYLASGLVLLVVFSIKHPDGVNDRTMVMWLLLLPSIGWGKWSYKYQPRPKGIELVPQASLVFSRMGTLHAILLGIGFLAVVSTLMGVWHVPDPMGPDSISNQTGNASAAGFDLMISGAAVGFGLLAFMFILLGFAFWFAILSVVPWVIGGSIRRNYQRQLVLQAPSGIPSRPLSPPEQANPK
ncbi:MAG: hypothetical protein M9900_03090 [Flavobacteriales bacterium]|nr:hypothetical protein [Flavobacteriales bacterium]